MEQRLRNLSPQRDNMISTIKFLIVTFLAILGVKNFGQEILEDIFDNPVQYSTSLTTGMLTYLQLPVTTSDLVLPELIKFIFFIFGAFVSCVIVFVTKKLLEPLWEQKIKKVFYKWFGLK